MTRTWNVMPQPAVRSRGNFWVLDYGGTGPADHIYTAWYAQRDIWRYFLVPRWNVGPKCRYADMKNPVAGYGLGAECVPNRVMVPAGVYPTAGWGPLLAALEGLAVGTSLGYLLGHRIGT